MAGKQIALTGLQVNGEKPGATGDVMATVV